MRRSFLSNLEHIFWLSISLSLSLLLVACGNDSGIHIKVSNLADKSAAPLTDLILVAGDKKYSWSTLAGGESMSVTLRATPDSGREVGLIYSQTGELKSYDGPRLGISEQGYRVLFQINAIGVVSSRYCALPCSLDD
jgi:hypothetical protein